MRLNKAYLSQARKIRKEDDEDVLFRSISNLCDFASYSGGWTRYWRFELSNGKTFRHSSSSIDNAAALREIYFQIRRYLRRK